MLNCPWYSALRRYSRGSVGTRYTEPACLSQNVSEVACHNDWPSVPTNLTIVPEIVHVIP